MRPFEDLTLNEILEVLGYKAVLPWFSRDRAKRDIVNAHGQTLWTMTAHRTAEHLHFTGLYDYAERAYNARMPSRILIVPSRNLKH